jgi:hypothetical protein
MTSRSYGFELKSAPLASGGRISLVTHGRMISYDSSGTSIDRTASPYVIELFVLGHGSGDLNVSTVQLTGVESGRSTSPPFSPLRILDDSTRFSQASRVELPFEDHMVLIHLEAGTGSSARRDTVRLMMRKKYVERRFTISEWLRGLLA